MKVNGVGEQFFLRYPDVYKYGKDTLNKQLMSLRVHKIMLWYKFYVTYTMLRRSWSRISTSTVSKYKIYVVLLNVKYYIT